MRNTEKLKQNLFKYSFLFYSFLFWKLKLRCLNVVGLCMRLMKTILGEQFLTSLKETDTVFPLHVSPPKRLPYPINTKNDFLPSTSSFNVLPVNSNPLPFL